MSECPIVGGLEFLDEIYCPFKAEFQCPDTCPYAPILKLLAEAKEVIPLKDVQGASYKEGNVLVRRDANTDVEQVTFWIRR